MVDSVGTLHCIFTVTIPLGIAICLGCNDTCSLLLLSGINNGYEILLALRMECLFVSYLYRF